MGMKISCLSVVKPSNVVTLLNSFGDDFKLLFIFDEFDNVSKEKTRALFADLIKSLSDNNVNSTIIIVGIADNVESLVGGHQSLERCLKQVKMPRMKKEELEEIITSGLQKLDMAIDEKIKKQIVDFSSGFPHYVHLLCEHGCKELIKNDKKYFVDEYLLIAIKSGVENTSEQLRASFKKAVLTSNSSSKWRDLIFACANSDVDEFNTFTASEVVKQYNKRTKGRKVINSNINYNLNQLLTSNRGEILVKLGKGQSTCYTFKNPMMKAFIKLRIHVE